MTEENYKPPLLLEVRMMDPTGAKIGVHCEAAALIHAVGTDPAIWASVMGAILENIVRHHASCLTDPTTGEHPSRETIRERILDCLGDAIDECAKQDPVGVSSQDGGTWWTAH